MDASLSPRAIMDEEEDEEDLDETLTERLIGLSEMFPEGLRTFCGSAVSTSVSLSKSGYNFSRNILWVLVSAASILVLPAVFEAERAQEQEKQKQQERQILLGPNAAVSSGGQMLPPGMVPGMMPPPR